MPRYRYSHESDDEDESTGIKVNLARDEEKQMPRKIDKLQELCSRLKKNDPDVTVVEATDPFPYNYSVTLGRALDRNTHVTTIALNLPVLFRYESNEIYYLRKFIQASSTLQKVRFERGQILSSGQSSGQRNYVDHNGVAWDFFKAVAENANIQHLDIDCHVSSKALAWLLGNCQSELESLNLYLGDFGAQGGERIASAFGANQSLKSLTVKAGSELSVVNTTLIGLRSHTRLCELHLLCGDGPPTELVELISLLESAVPLTSLRLESYMFYNDDMRNLARSMYTKQTLSTISFRNCEMNENAIGAIVGYMQSPKEERSLQSFDLSLDLDYHADRSLTDRILSIPSDIIGGPTVGSSLQHLGLSGCACAGFWQYMETNASTVRLWSVSWSYHLEGDDMIRCIPQLVRLRVLDVDFNWAESDIDSATFLRAVRRNGSLHKVSLSRGSYARYKDETERSFDGDALAKLEAFGRRNELLPELATLPNPDSTPLSLMSPLLQAANGAPRMASSNILTGLLALDEESMDPFLERNEE